MTEQKARQPPPRSLQNMDSFSRQLVALCDGQRSHTWFVLTTGLAPIHRARAQQGQPARRSSGGYDSFTYPLLYQRAVLSGASARWRRPDAAIQIPGFALGYRLPLACSRTEAESPAPPSGVSFAPGQVTARYPLKIWDFIFTQTPRTN